MAVTILKARDTVCRCGFFSLLVGLCCYMPSFVLGMDTEDAVLPKDTPSKGVVADSDWYDAEASEIVPVPVVNREEDSIHRDSRWLPQATAVPNPVGKNTPAILSGSWIDEGWTFSSVISWLFLLGIVVLTGFLVAWLVRPSGLAGNLSTEGSFDSVASRERLLERIKHLPEELRRENLDYRAEAERLMKNGAFDQAVILLLAYQLLILDRAACLRLNRGKTNRQYLREMRFAEEIGSDWFERVIILFERSYFGKIVIREAEFSRCWKENKMLEDRLASRMEGSE